MELCNPGWSQICGWSCHCLSSAGAGIRHSLLHFLGQTPYPPHLPRDLLRLQRARHALLLNKTPRLLFSPIPFRPLVLLFETESYYVFQVVLEFLLQDPECWAYTACHQTQRIHLLSSSIIRLSLSGTYHVAQAALKLMGIFLPQPPQCCLLSL